jgi:Spy/CpxP family protein refolding chaperone
MSSNFKPWLVLAIIFIAGILTGSALTMALSPHFAKPPAPRDMRQHWMARLTDRLKLTPDQQAKIQPILADATTKAQALHRDEVQRGSQIFKAANEQISALLTPDQKVELQKMEAEREKMFSGHMHRHGGPDDDGRMPPPPPPAPPANAPPPNP